jgi:hypothetical protein
MEQQSTPKPPRPLKRDPLFILSITLIVVGSFLMLIRPPTDWDQVAVNMDKSLVHALTREPGTPLPAQEGCERWTKFLVAGHWQFDVCYNAENKVTSRERRWQWGW